MVKVYEKPDEDLQAEDSLRASVKRLVKHAKKSRRLHGGLTPSAHSVKEQLTLLLEEYVDANLMLKAKQRIINNKILRNNRNDGRKRKTDWRRSWKTFRTTCAITTT